MPKHPAIYILTNHPKGTFYTGVTSDLIQRIYQHKHSITLGFTSRYNCKLLVYYELYEEMEIAIEREKQIKAGSRKKKIELIEKMNPDWKDLYDGLIG
jgi:putative endonuclease